MRTDGMQKSAAEALMKENHVKKRVLDENTKRYKKVALEPDDDEEEPMKIEEIKMDLKMMTNIVVIL